MTVVQHLQQRVEDVRMGLLDLVEQHDGERLAAPLLGELATLLVTDVSRRSTEQTRCRILLGELRHVHANQRVLIVEQELGQRLGQLGLADAGRAGEDERARRTLRILEAHTSAANRTGQRGNRFVLADDALVQLGLHAEQLLRLGLGELEHRNAGGRGDHLGDHILVHDHLDIGLALAPRGFLLLALRFQLLLVVAQLGGLLEVLVLDSLVLLGGDLRDLLVKFLELGRGGQALDAQPRAGLVDQVDGLVGQVAVLDVAGRQLRGGLQRAVGDGHMVVVLVARAQALEDLDGLRDCRLMHLNRLETTFQRRVLLDVLAVLVGGGGADGLELTASQHGLEHVRRAQGAVRRTGTDDRVNLVDEQHDVAARLDLLEHLLEAFLEIAAVARAGHHGAQIQRIDLLVLQRLRHVAGVDLLREAFDDGGLADARLADQHGVVLRAARQHDHDTFDLVGAPDHRVELALGRFGGQVAPELVQNGRTGLAALVLHAAGVGQIALAGGVGAAAVAMDHVDSGRTQFAQVDIHLDEHLGAHALAFADQAEQDVLGADIAVTELQRLAQTQLQHLLGVRSKGNVPVGGGIAFADHLLDLLAGVVQGHSLGCERLGGDPLTFADQAEQQVFGADVVVLESTRLFLRQHDHAPCTVGKPFEHACPSISIVHTTLPIRDDVYAFPRDNCAHNAMKNDMLNITCQQGGCHDATRCEHRVRAADVGRSRRHRRWGGRLRGVVHGLAVGAQGGVLERQGGQRGLCVDAFVGYGSSAGQSRRVGEGEQGHHRATAGLGE